MIREKKQEFTRRLSNCNRSEMIVIMYEILFSYLDDGIQANAADDYEGFKLAVGKAGQVLARLMDESLRWFFGSSETRYFRTFDAAYTADCGRHDISEGQPN